MGGGVESLVEGSWPFDQPSAPNGDTPMATLDAQSYYPEPEHPTLMYFEAAEANSTVGFISYPFSNVAPNFEYSLDGETWYEWPYETISIPGSSVTYQYTFETITLAEKNSRVYLKGINPYGIPCDEGGDHFNRFVLTGSLYCRGNAQSIVDGDNPTLVAKPMPRFYGSSGEASALLSAPELPATTLAESCYRYMFAGCTSLTQAPELPATTLAYWCYSYMFSGCTSLNSVTCLAKDILAGSCTFEWLSNVSTTGTFTKSPNMSSWTTGDDGIPSGWTVQDYTE